MPTMPMTLAQRLKREVEQAREAKERAAKQAAYPVAEHCAMEAYFEAHKNDPNGGASMAMLVCRCSRCAGRVTA